VNDFAGTFVTSQVPRHFFPPPRLGLKLKKVSADANLRLSFPRIAQLFMKMTGLLTVLAVQLCSAPLSFFAQGQQAPIAAYGFDEGTGSVAIDASGNGNDGNISGAVRVAGRFGWALSLNGVNDLVLVNDTSLLRLTTAMTLEAWVWPGATASGMQGLVDKADSYFLAAALSAGNGPAAGGTFGGRLVAVEAASPLLTGQWVHLAATYDGSSVVLYINGLFAASTSRQGRFASSTSSLRIGGTGTAGENFQGLIDEVRLYDRALSQAEIVTDMNNPVNATTDQTPPLALLDSPLPGALLTGLVPLLASATDDQGVAGVRFLVDGTGFGNEVPAAALVRASTRPGVVSAYGNVWFRGQRRGGAGGDGCDRLRRTRESLSCREPGHATRFRRSRPRAQCCRRMARRGCREQHRGTRRDTTCAHS